MNKFEKCKNCEGKGYMIEDFHMISSPKILRCLFDCPFCNGLGKVEIEIQDRRTKRK